jgi:predicted O-methyltransferase YrrM
VPGIEAYTGIEVERNYVTQMRCQRAEVPDDPGRYVRHDPRFDLIIRPCGSFDLSAQDLPQVDAAFIDADHSRLGVMQDYTLATQRVRPGGIIIFHDDNGLPVVQVSETLDDLAAAGAPIVHVADSWLAYERV